MKPYRKTLPRPFLLRMVVLEVIRMTTAKDSQILNNVNLHD